MSSQHVMLQMNALHGVQSTTLNILKAFKFIYIYIYIYPHEFKERINLWNKLCFCHRLRMCCSGLQTYFQGIALHSQLGVDFEFLSSKMEGKFYGKIVRYLKPLDAFTSRGSKRSDLGITLSGPFLKHHRCRKTHMGSPAQVVPIKTQGGKAVGPLSVFRAFKGGSLRFPPETSR